MNIIFYPILGSVFWLKYLSVSKSLSKMYFGPKYIFENDILRKVGYFKKNCGLSSKVSRDNKRFLFLQRKSFKIIFVQTFFLWLACENPV